jgi:hypothetical protein
MRTPLSFGVGERLFSSEFQIVPQELASWDRAQVLGDRDDRPSFRPRLERPLEMGAPIPDGLLLARALEAIERSSNLGGCAITPTSLTRLRSHAPIVVGERLTAVATVRYRSAREARAYLTLAIDLRAGGRKLAELEVGVEVSRRRGAGPSLAAAA